MSRAMSTIKHQLHSWARIAVGTAVAFVSLPPTPVRAHVPASAVEAALGAAPATQPTYEELMSEAERRRQAKSHAEAAALHGQAYRTRPERDRFDLTGEITIRAAMADYQLALVSHSDDLEQINAKLALLEAQRALLAEFIAARTPKATPWDIANAYAELDPQIEELERRKAQLEAEQEPLLEPSPPATMPTPSTVPEPEPSAPSPTPMSDDPGSSEGRGLVVSGAILTGVGVAALGVMAGGMVMASNANDFDSTMSYDERADQLARGRTGNALSVSGAVAGGVLAATGVALIVVGVTRRNRARTAVAPMVGRGMAGIGWQGRF
jgi:hypothetical protein